MRWVVKTTDIWQAVQGGFTAMVVDTKPVPFAVIMRDGVIIQSKPGDMESLKEWAQNRLKGMSQ